VTLTLHHVGVLVNDIAQKSAFYTRRLGYEVQSEVIHDRLQTALAQFLKLPGQTTYLELISPDGPDSKLSSALRKGEGLHHLCYGSAQIENDFARLRGEGLVPICDPVPATAFPGRKIAWLVGLDRVLIELVERGAPGEL
jgi:methylmalonyl-CoA/ethylmalonyl-CoA epimerase